MPRPLTSKEISNLERRILRALCGPGISRGQWEALSTELADHHWQESEHRIIYDALSGIRSRDTRTWRDQLPAQATRMGFPDVDWALYLANDAELAEPQPRLDESIRDLKAAMSAKLSASGRGSRQPRAR